MTQSRSWPVVLAVALLACGGSKKSDRQPAGNTSRPGFGDSTSRPVGLSYALPAGVVLEGDIAGVDARCWDQLPVGDGTVVGLCLGLRNTTSAAIAVTLPPGLVFISRSLDFQNGVILTPVVIEVPGDTVVIVNLGTHCTNLVRHVPDAAAPYDLGPITQDTQLQEIATIISGKTIDGSDSWTIQGAVWSVTDGGGLTAQDRTDLAAL